MTGLSRIKGTKGSVDASTALEGTSDNGLRGLVGYNMKCAFNAMHADLLETLKHFELRMMTFSTLTVIVENPGLSQAQLADMLAIERSNVVVLVDELEQRDLITREKVPTDRRAYALEATLAGRRLQEKALRACFEHERRILKEFSPDDTRQLIDRLHRIEAAAKALATRSSDPSS